AVLVLPPVVGRRMLGIATARVEQQGNAEDDAPQKFGHHMLLVAAMFLFWYPGPLSTLLALLLLIPGVRRLLQQWAFSRLQKAVRTGNLRVSPGMNGVVFTSTPGGAGASPAGPTEPLKRAEGTVVDSAAELPAPEERNEEKAE
ncbi:MAG: FxsA family protein, partial [Planctomycetota bacterium]|nr:FxsA family protein [Planctomycetota bacterium]